MSDTKRIAVVTGASKGIGKAIYDLFVERDITAIGVSRHIELGKRSTFSLRTGLRISTARLLT